MIVLRKIALPGFKGMSLYDVLRFFYSGLTDTKFTLMSAAMSYNFFISLFSTLFLIFIFIPKIPIDNLQENVMEMIANVVPIEGITYVQNIVKGYLSRQDSDIWLVVLMIALAFWGATRGVIAMMKAFSKNEDVFKRRGLLEHYGTAFFIFILLGVLVVLAAALLILGGAGIEFMVNNDWLSEGFSIFLLQTLRYLLTLLTIFLAISTIYYLAPKTRKRWHFFSPGAITAGILILFAMIGLDIFVQRFTHSAFNAIYGSIGTIILLLVWFNYLSIMLLIGFELNTAIDLAELHSACPEKPKEERKGIPSSEALTDSPVQDGAR
jgi:membrane protein